MNELIALSPDILADRPELKRRSIDEAAREFETMLISQWLKSARVASQVLAEGSDMAGADSYMEMAEKALAQTMADRGTFGLARMILEELTPIDSATGHDSDSTAKGHAEHPEAQLPPSSVSPANLSHGRESAGSLPGPTASAHQPRDGAHD